ncbi:type II toxin-antitoxin system antitoxin VapB33 [soil metagenome]
MMPVMRTTLTLDPDVSRLIQDAVHRERRPRKQVVNDALRRALTPAAARRERVRVVPHRSAVRPGLDLERMNQLADELEDEAILDAAKRSR